MLVFSSLRRAGRHAGRKLALLLALLVAVPVSLAMVMARGDLLSTLFQRHASIMLLVDPETGEIVDANQAAGDFYGYPVATLRRMTIQQINALEPEAVMAERQRARAEARNYFIFPHRLANGALRTVEVHSSPVILESGRQVLFSILHDVTNRAVSPDEQVLYQQRLEQAVASYTERLEADHLRERDYFIAGLVLALAVILMLMASMLRRSRAEATLIHREEQLTTLIEAMPDIVCFKDGQGRWQLANAFDLKLFGLEHVDYRGKTDQELARYQDFHREAFMDCVVSDEQAWQARQMVRCEEVIRVPDAQARIFDIIKVPLFHADGRRKGLVVVGRDITEHKRAEAEIEQLAYFDPLTGLPNRRLYLDRLETALAAAQHSRVYGAVLFVDLDGFNTLNDARGHEVGDQVLQECARRIRAVLGDADTVARFSGDEYGVLLPQLTRQEHLAVRQARSVGERIRLCLAQPISLGAGEVSLSASIGISLFPSTQRNTALDLIKFADTAMHQAKAAGRNQVRFFEPGMQARVEARFSMEGDLRQALARGQMQVYIQPQVDQEGKVRGGEALLRWLHPEQGMVSPVVFIPVAEESGVILALGDWVLEEACRLLNHPAMQHESLRISVNVSPRQFHRPDFVQRVKQVLAQTGADPNYLTLEVTEGLVIDNVHQTAATMSELRALGIHFSIDDFGTGYSSLSYLKRLPLNELKIDKSFVQDAPENPSDAALVDVILSVARHLRLKVVAEGVETPDQASFLTARGEMLLQGYLYGRPVPIEDFLKQLQQG
ncbi:MAG: EAL domain-containing protein [Azovibrio sp.]|uniref:sensor domain-containing protein n=1 Tax=Azovibrio sp. TaxID=1872673 RepID=UPI003C77D4A2